MIRTAVACCAKRPSQPKCSEMRCVTLAAQVKPPPISSSSTPAAVLSMAAALAYPNSADTSSDCAWAGAAATEGAPSPAAGSLRASGQDHDVACEAGWARTIPDQRPPVGRHVGDEPGIDPVDRTRSAIHSRRDSPSESTGDRQATTATSLSRPNGQDPPITRPSSFNENIYGRYGMFRGTQSGRCTG